MTTSELKAPLDVTRIIVVEPLYDPIIENELMGVATEDIDSKENNTTIDTSNITEQVTEDSINEEQLPDEASIIINLIIEDPLSNYATVPHSIIMITHYIND